jgi:hypothetical protein
LKKKYNGKYKMTKWNKYRLYRLRDKVGQDPCGPEVPTRISIKARTQEEAERKALKLSQEGDFQLGPIIVRQETGVIKDE